MLQSWKDLLKAADLFKTLTMGDTKKELRTNAIKIITELNTSDFYIAYTQCLDEGTRIHKLFATYFDRTQLEIEVSIN